MLRRLVAFTALLVTAASAAAQAPPLKVYLDCHDHGCDFDFFRTQITAVNWVRDRQEADVHMLVSTQTTGSGGREYTTTFIGRGQFAGLTDTLKYVSPPAAPEDEVRHGLARTFSAGLVRYVARTDAAANLTINFGNETSAGAAAPPAQPKNDPWHSWVFRGSLNGFKQGEASFGNMNLHGSVSANRITQRHKTKFSIDDSFNQSSYSLSSGATFKNSQRGYGARLLQVQSLGAHWSAGLRSALTSSTYENQKRAFRLAPAVEYDVFPYDESTRRQLRVEYNIGAQWVSYDDTTIFNKLAETLPSQQIGISAAAREPWGSTNVGINGTSYLNDPSKYNVSTFSRLSLRLFKGFSLSLFVNYSKFNDQFYLLKHSFTDEEILTRQFARQTHYRYFADFGLSYTFGSIFNNVVNPRFGGGGGGSGGGMIFIQ